jgi:hypothetical protein
MTGFVGCTISISLAGTRAPATRAPPHNPAAGVAALTRRFKIVLVLVLVLEKWGWGGEVLEYPAKSELHPRSGLKMFTRRFALVLVLVLDSLRTECWSTGVLRLVRIAPHDREWTPMNANLRID